MSYVIAGEGCAGERSSSEEGNRAAKRRLAGLQDWDRSELDGGNPKLKGGAKSVESCTDG